MIFHLDGQEWDTNKPVYVIGYTLMRTWFPFESRKSSEYRNMQEAVHPLHRNEPDVIERNH